MNKLASSPGGQRITDKLHTVHVKVGENSDNGIIHTVIMGCISFESFVFMSLVMEVDMSQIWTRYYGGNLHLSMVCTYIMHLNRLLLIPKKTLVSLCKNCNDI